MRAVRLREEEKVGLLAARHRLDHTMQENDQVYAVRSPLQGCAVQPS